MVVVTPAWNEEATVGAVVTEARSAGYPIIVVDDGSRDRTAAVAAAAGAAVLRLPFNVGVGAALQTGFREALAADAQVVVQVDADGQHPIGQIPVLLGALGGERQLVFGSRFRAGNRPRGVRGIAMRSLARRASRVAGTTLTDSSSGFRAIGRPLLELFAKRFPTSYLGDTFGSILLASRHGFAVGEVPVAMASRQGGRPSTSPGRAALLVLRAIASSATTETRPE